MVKTSETSGTLTEENMYETGEDQRSLNNIQGTLDRAATGSEQYLSPKTAARWFQETREQKNPNAYFNQEIRPRMDEWKNMRQDFDSVTKDMKNTGTPKGWTILSPHQFWALPSKMRAQYLKEAKESIRKPENFNARWSKITDKVREFAKVTFNELGAASAGETSALLEGLTYKPKNEEELEGWETYVNGEMQKQMHAARRLYYDQLMDKLLGAKNEKLISTRVLREMRKKFIDENVSYKQKESYILSVLPQRIVKWREVKLQRERLLKHPGLRRLTSATVKNLASFKDENAFVEMKYPQRKGLADLIESLLLAEGNNIGHTHADVQKELQGYVQDGCMHHSKIGTWMKRIFIASATPEQIAAFMKNTVRPNAERWNIARKRLNKVNTQLNAKGVPHGLRRLSLDQFLFQDYGQRIAYLDEAESRMESDVNTPGELTNLTLGIRYHLDTQDWDSAEELLIKAKRINPEDKAVKSMENYWKTHRPNVVQEKTENPDPGKILDEMRSMMENVPGMLRRIYIKAAVRGPKTLESILAGSYNLVWVHEHRYSTQHKDREQSESELNKEKTKHYIENGHSRRLEHNILEGDTASSAAIRDDCTKAQMLHVGDTDGCHAIVEKFDQHKEDFKFRYWSTIHTKDISYEQHRMVVRGYNFKLKMGMRELDKMGYRFTLSGAPQKKGGVSRTVSPINTQKYASATRSLSV